MTHDLEHTVVGSVLAGVTADRCGQCGACDRTVVLVAMGNREAAALHLSAAQAAELDRFFRTIRPAGEPSSILDEAREIVAGARRT